MKGNGDIIHHLRSHYTFKVLQAFKNMDAASRALEFVGKALNDLYRSFEPAYFSGEFYFCKHFDNKPVFKENKALVLIGKNQLLNRTKGRFIIQGFDDDPKLLIWENQDPTELIKKKKTLVYLYSKNKEFFFANGEKIEFTEKPFGSMFAPQFHDLITAISDYSSEKIYASSCSHFQQSWYDNNRLFFKGGGSGSNIPEQYMQLSLHEFLRTEFRGIGMDTSREHNLLGDASKPKPVDIRVHWREANRTALIEIKYMGAVKKADDKIYEYSDRRANDGIVQLKEYHDKAMSDSPTTIHKSILVVIDGRRCNLQAATKTISCADGLYYQDIDINIDKDKVFHLSVQGFEKPIRIFAAPICR